MTTNEFGETAGSNQVREEAAVRGFAEWSCQGEGPRESGGWSAGTRRAGTVGDVAVVAQTRWWGRRCEGREGGVEVISEEVMVREDDEERETPYMGREGKAGLPHNVQQAAFKPCGDEVEVTEEKGDGGGGVEDPEQSGPKRGSEGVDRGGEMESTV